MPESPARMGRDLIWVVQLSSAFSLGTLAALLYSVRTVNPRIRIEFSAATLVAFALAATASWAFWHIIFRLSDGKGMAAREEARRKRWLATLASILGGALLLAFIYPLRGFSPERLSEVTIGALIALAFLTVLGLLFWRIVRYLER